MISLLESVYIVALLDRVLIKTIMIKTFISEYEYFYCHQVMLLPSHLACLLLADDRTVSDGPFTS